MLGFWFLLGCSCHDVNFDGIFFPLRFLLSPFSCLKANYYLVYGYLKRYCLPDEDLVRRQRSGTCTKREFILWTTLASLLGLFLTEFLTPGAFSDHFVYLAGIGKQVSFFSAECGLFCAAEMVDFPAISNSCSPLGISGRSPVSVCTSRLRHNTDRDAGDKFSLLDEGEFFSRSLPPTGLFKHVNIEDGSGLAVTWGDGSSLNNCSGVPGADILDFASYGLPLAQSCMAYQHQTCHA